MTHKTYTPPEPWERTFYDVAKFFIFLYFKIIWRTEVVGLEKVPKSGGVLLAANHQSFADPPLVGCFLDRAIFYFAKEELFKVPVLGWIIKHVNAFPVKRFEHDIGAFKRAQHLLENGQVVLVFPEGRRNRSGLVGKAKSGVGMLAYKAKVPVVPVCVWNTNKMWTFTKIRVEYLDPIFPKPVDDEKAQYQIFADRVMRSVADSKIKML